MARPKYLTVTGIGVAVVAILLVAMSMWVMGPAPPKKIRLATGNPGGAYATFGNRYVEVLRRNGLEVEVVHTRGSIDNLERLVDNQVEAAFVQGGTYSFVDDSDRVIRAIASLYREPLWVVYRGDQAVEKISDFAGKTISIGPQRSGTEVLSQVLLEVNGVNQENSKLVHLPLSDVGEQLEAGEIDCAFVVSSFESPLLQKLLQTNGVRLVDFRRHNAYSAIFPYLTSIELTEGVLDLKHNIPKENTDVLAAATMLTCRRDLHPMVVVLLSKAAREVHAEGNRIDAAGEFPSAENLDIAVHDTAETYLQSGESFLSRVLPYWALRWLLKAQIIILPLLAVWLPFAKLLPLLYRMRVRRLVQRLYISLREVEMAIEQAETSKELNGAIDSLNSLRADMERFARKIPAAYQQDVYHWRTHVALVQQEIEARLAEIASPKERPEERSTETPKETLPKTEGETPGYRPHILPKKETEKKDTKSTHDA